MIISNLQKDAHEDEWKCVCVVGRGHAKELVSF